MMFRFTFVALSLFCVLWQWSGHASDAASECEDAFWLGHDSGDVLQYLRQAPWEQQPGLAAPSAQLRDYALGHDADDAGSLAWLLEARNLVNAGRFTDAGALIVDNVAQDRAMLSCLSVEIDAIAFPLARKLQQAGLADAALDVLSASAVASGAPVAYLRSVLRRLDAAEIKELWSGNPYIVLVDFDRLENSRLDIFVDRQRRGGVNSNYDSEVGLRGKGSAQVDISASTHEGLFIFGWQEQFMTLTPGASGLRACIRMEEPAQLEFIVQVLGNLWEDRPFEWLLRIPMPEPCEGGWLCFDTGSVREDLVGALLFQYGWARAFDMHLARPSALEQARLFIAGIGFDLPAGGANRCWLDRIELYLPEGSWEQEARMPAPSEFGSF